MKKIKLKAPAKVNLTLDIIGQKDGYHELESFVCSVDVADEITLKMRKDSRVTLTTLGLPIGVETMENNAYKAAMAFKEKFNVGGVDIKIKKNIPIGAGLGGSSADIAGVLKGMKALFEVSEDVAELANSLGSDCSYMLNGGFAVMKGRGEIVEKKVVNLPLYFLIIVEKKSISSRNCYKKYDEQRKTYQPCTKAALDAINKGDFEVFTGVIKNDLYPAAKALMKEIDFNLSTLKKAGAPTALMTGSGSAVYGVFKSEKERDVVYKKLHPLFKEQLIKAKSI